MRWQLASTFAVMAMSTGCYGPDTEDCMNGYLCPAGLACAAPGVCAEPALVQECSLDGRPGEFKENFAACDHPGNDGGVCLSGVCEPCTSELAGCTFMSWTEMPSPLTTALEAVWASAATANDPAPLAFAGGTEGVLLEYDGLAWRRSITFPGAALPITGIWASSRDDVFVVQAPHVWHWDGADWTDIALVLPSTAATLIDISGTSSMNVLAAGDNGTFVRWNGSVWTSVREPPGRFSTEWRRLSRRSR